MVGVVQGAIQVAGDLLLEVVATLLPAMVALTREVKLRLLAAATQERGLLPWVITEVLLREQEVTEVVEEEEVGEEDPPGTITTEDSLEEGEVEDVGVTLTMAMILATAEVEAEILATAEVEAETLATAVVVEEVGDTVVTIDKAVEVMEEEGVE